LWRSRFDVTVDFHSYPFSTTSSLMALLSGSPTRIGFLATGDFEQYRELSRKIFNVGLPAPPENLHESSKSLLLVKKMFRGKARIGPGPAVPPAADPQLQARVGRFFQEIGANKGTRLLGIHPTLQKKDNRWAPEKYVELSQKLSGVKNLKVIVIHGKGEGEDLEQFKAMLGEPIRLASLAQGKPASHPQTVQKGVQSGETPGVFYLPDDDVLFIREAAKRMKALVCGDSGIMHACAGVTKVLAVFGPSEPSRWGPLDRAKRGHVLFRKKDRLCDSVEPSEVAKAVFKSIKH
jgi:ADP-heptose:LPS heptosyltransferase